VIFQLASHGPAGLRVDMSRETGARQSGGHGETGGEIGRGNSASGTSPDSARQGPRQGAGQEGETCAVSDLSRETVAGGAGRGRGRARHGEARPTAGDMPRQTARDKVRDRVARDRARQESRQRHPRLFRSLSREIESHVS
jgi:hypothetical protein